MVRGNWQKRVETADARRKEAKQRKQRSEDKRHAKLMVQDLMDFMNRNASRWNDGSPMLHIWTDSLPSDSPPLLDILEQEQSGKPGKRRGRSDSIEAEHNKGRRSGRASQATPPSSKKKAHPRSKESYDAPSSVAEGTEAPRLCRCHFFSGKCDGQMGKRGSNCRHVHYPSRYKTLASVLITQANSSAKEILSLSENAVISSQSSPEGDGNDTGAMDMVYYFSAQPQNSEQNDEEESSAQHTKISETVAEAMSSRNCGLGSIVFFAVGNTLIFDRYRGGVLSASSSGTDAGGETSLANAAGNHPTPAQDIFMLPSHLLEHVLSFLPDTAYASSSLVCTGWQREIKLISPEFWRTLLHRRQWPCPDESASTASAEDLRNEYALHYLAVRDVRALQMAIDTNKSVDEREVSFQAFSTRRDAPQYPNCCVAVEVWSPNHILAGYSHDCTLRLFNSSPRSPGSREKHCRELLCRSVDPYQNTKRRMCQLVALGIDDETIGALCHVSAGGRGHDSFILTVLSREDFLVEESDGQKDIDVGKSVIAYILSVGVDNDRLLALHDFLEIGGVIDDFEVLVSHSIAACGRGRFMVEVSISIPNLDYDDADEERNTMTLQLDRKLVLFSAGNIVWLGSSFAMAREMIPRNEDVSLSCLPHKGGKHAACYVASVTGSSPAMLILEVESSGNVKRTEITHTAETVRDEILADGFALVGINHRPVVMTSTAVVVADTVVREVEGREEFKTVVSFYPRLPAEDERKYSTLTIDGNCESFRLDALRDSHVVLICRTRVSNSGEEVDETEEAGRGAIHGVVIDLRTRKAIERVCLMEGFRSELEPALLPGSPLLFAAKGGTVGGGIYWRGIAMTGNNVRSTAEASCLADRGPSKANKRKKKRLQSKGGKKDGFARGMSLRG